MFVDRETFERRRDAGGFLEWTEFLGNLYGTPVLSAPQSEKPESSDRSHSPEHPGTSADLVLEIDLQGALSVKARHPDALVVLLLPPSEEVQAERLRARGDDEEEVARRIALGREEERFGRALTPHVVVNDDVDKAVSQLEAIIAGRRTGD
jgi:guanylate kinase